MGVKGVEPTLRTCHGKLNKQFSVHGFRHMGKRIPYAKNGKKEKEEKRNLFNYISQGRAAGSMDLAFRLCGTCIN